MADIQPLSKVAEISRGITIYPAQHDVTAQGAVDDKGHLLVRLFDYFVKLPDISGSGYGFKISDYETLLRLAVALVVRHGEGLFVSTSKHDDGTPLAEFAESLVQVHLAELRAESK